MPPQKKQQARESSAARAANESLIIESKHGGEIAVSSMPSPAQAAAGAPASTRIDRFLIDLADALNTTLELDALLMRVAELVKRVIDYEIFAILLLNERAQDMRMRFQIGHKPEAERLRIKVGHGVTGQAAQGRTAVLVNDVSKIENYINAHPAVRSELAVPLMAKNRVIGVIDIQASQVDYFTEEHGRMLTLVASRIAVAIENARLYTRISRQAQSLMVLNDISRELTSILDLDQLLKRMADLVTRVIDYQMFSILLLNDAGDKLEHRFSLRFRETIQLKHDIPLGRGLVGAAAQAGMPVLVPDVSKDERYISVNPETRSELCIPLIYKDKVIGVLDLEHTRRNYFNEDHVRTMTVLAAQVAIAIENARLYEKIARQEQRLERDLAMAREVQFRLLPPGCPKSPVAEFAARFSPAWQIGGDLYDFLSHSTGKYGIALGDVSGKGAPAALYAALVSGIIRAEATINPSPAEMLTVVNRSLGERKLDAQYVTLIYAVWDDATHVLKIANSGLPRPIFHRAGHNHVVESTGLPLGLFEDAQYDELAIEAKAGDIFIFFSDGIVDALDGKGHQFGRGRVEHLVTANAQRSIEEIVQAIFAGVQQHSEGVASFDDSTIVGMKVKEPQTAKAKRKEPAPQP